MQTFFFFFPQKGESFAFPILSPPLTNQKKGHKGRRGEECENEKTKPNQTNKPTTYGKAKTLISINKCAGQNHFERNENILNFLTRNIFNRKLSSLRRHVCDVS